jgi:7-cyano-7-deazaguanine synthase
VKQLVLLSGGLDSTVALAWATKNGPIAGLVHFQYGQTHEKEVYAANNVARFYGYTLRTYELNFKHIEPTKVGALLDLHLDVRKAHTTVKDQTGEDVSATFVPGRNIIFLAYAGSICDSEEIESIVMGVNAVDYSGYPDCRPAFIGRMEEALSHGLRYSVSLLTPLLHLSKAEIIDLGMNLGAPLHLTWSCYSGTSRPCGECPSCVVRAKGFREAGVADPALT